jgi:hypothetical protein
MFHRLVDEVLFLQMEEKVHRLEELRLQDKYSSAISCITSTPSIYESEEKSKSREGLPPVKARVTLSNTQEVGDCLSEEKKNERKRGNRKVEEQMNDNVLEYSNLPIKEATTLLVVGTTNPDLKYVANEERLLNPKAKEIMKNKEVLQPLRRRQVTSFGLSSRTGFQYIFATPKSDEVPRDDVYMKFILKPKDKDS